MASGIEPTRFSKISTGYINSVKSNAKYGDTGYDFSCINGAASTLSVSGAVTLGGAQTYLSTQSAAGGVTMQSTLTVRGQTNLDGGIQIGGGQVINVISTGTAAISLGAIPPLESSSVQTFAASGLSRGDALFITVDSIYANAAANRDISWMASSTSTVGEANVWGVNSTLTSVTPTASTFIRWVRIKGGAYPAA